MRHETGLSPERQFPKILARPIGALPTSGADRINPNQLLESG